MRRSRAIENHEGFFLQDLGSGAIPWGSLPNRGYYAVYDTLPEWGTLLHIVKGVDALREAIETGYGKTMLPSRVFVETAACEEDLPDPEYARLVGNVLRGVEAIKKRKDRAGLRRVRAALESKGERPGPKIDSQAKRWLVDLLYEVGGGRPLKTAVQHPRTPASASACLSRFCWDFYEWCVLLRAEKREAWQEPYVSKKMAEKFGFAFLDEKLADHDLVAAEEAYRRGKRQVPKTDWPDERLIGPRQIG